MEPCAGVRAAGGVCAVPRGGAVQPARHREPDRLPVPHRALLHVPGAAAWVDGAAQGQVFARVCGRLWATCATVRVHACLRACNRASAESPVYIRACVHAHVCVRVRACVRVRVRACARGAGRGAHPLPRGPVPRHPRRRVRGGVPAVPARIPLPRRHTGPRAVQRRHRVPRGLRERHPVPRGVVLPGPGPRARALPGQQLLSGGVGGAHPVPGRHVLPAGQLVPAGVRAGLDLPQ